MGLIEKVVEAIFALFIIAIFAIYVFPALGEATGQNVIIYIIALVLMGIGIVVAVVTSILKRY